MKVYRQRAGIVIHHLLLTHLLSMVQRQNQPFNHEKFPFSALPTILVLKKCLYIKQ